MNLNPLKFKTNFWVILSAVLIMALFYLFYFGYYVKTKENSVTAARFRVLDQMGKNIDKKLKVYISNAKDLKGKINGEWKSIEEKNRGEDTALLITFLIDTLNNKGDINKNLKVNDIIPYPGQVKNMEKLAKEPSPKKYYFPLILKNPPFVQPGKGEAVMIMETPYDKLISGLQRGDVFDGLILIKDSVVIYNTLGQEMIIIPNPENNTGESVKNDKTGGQPAYIGNIVSGEAFDFDVSNISFKAFLKPIEVNNETWYAIGLMKAETFRAASRSIESWIIVLLSLVLIFIILGMPFIKLKVLSKTEQLDTGTIISYSLSVILGGAILALFVIFLTREYTSKQEVNLKLKNLSDTIYQSFIGELSEAYQQIEEYDNKARMINGYLNLPDPENHYNSSVKRDIFTSKEYYPGKYPYGDYYFWTNKKGIQAAYFTPFKMFGRMSDLSTRDYVNKKDEWFFPGSTDKKFRLQSIVSVSSGTVKAAISRKGISPERPVVAVSTRLYSIISTIIPRDYAFCIIDKKGKVWFHSNENLNLRENFIEECNNNKSLQAAIYADIAKTINVRYYNQPHRIFIRPIDNLPLYLITMYNKKPEKSFQAEVITLTLFFVAFLLLMMFLQIALLLLIERNFKLALTRNILMKLTRPIMRLNGRYKYLINLYIIILVVTVPFLIFYTNMVAVASVFTLTIILFAYSYQILNQNETKKDQRKWFTAFNLLLLLIVNAYSYYISGPGEFWKIIVFEAVIIVTIFLAHIILKKDTGDNSKYWINYSRLLVMYLILIGIMPTLKFYEIASNNETGIRAKHSLLDLMKQREQRNLTLISYFQKINPSEKRTEIFTKRKELGIYTLFDDSTRFLKNRPQDNLELMPLMNHWDTIICFMRPFYDTYIIENKYLPLKNPLNKNINWYRNKKQLLLEYNSLTEDLTRDTIKPFFIKSSVPQFNLLLPFRGKPIDLWHTVMLSLLFWLIIAGIVFVFYHLIIFGVHRIFNYQAITNYFDQEFGKIVMQQLVSDKNLFIVRLSPLDDTDHFFKKFSSIPNTILQDWSKSKDIEKIPGNIDRLIAKNSKAKENETPTVLIKGFDYEYDHPENFIKKLHLSGQLENRNDIKLVITWQVNPLSILKHYQHLSEEMKQNKEAAKDATQGNGTLYREIVNQLNRLIRTNVLLYFPVRYELPETLQKKYCDDKPKKISNEKMIENELNAGDFLNRLKPALIEFNNSHKDEDGKEISEEMIIDKICSLAEKYYEDLFNSCPPEEQYVLFDMAHDMIMNPRNEKAIFSLLKKGLLVKKCYKINLMNMSFRKFLLLKMNKAKKQELEQAIGKETGTWQGYKVMLLLIITSLFVFIAMANQDFLENLNQLFVAIGGGIAVITGILGLLSRKGKPAS